MKDTPDNCQPDSFGQARAMLLLDQYDRLRFLADGKCVIVPLKGISLLKSVYSELLDREAGDIDILVYPPDKAPLLIERLLAAGYKRQFSHLADMETLTAKRKAALTGGGPLSTDVDIHLDFITKKFFRRHCGTFNKDALRRCRGYDGKYLNPDSEVSIPNCSEYRMNPVDEWLFLAQHACFHRFENCKWLRDLDALLATFSKNDIRSLHYRIKKYGFRRIYRVCMNEIGDRQLSSSWREQQFDRLTDAILHRPHRRLTQKVIGSMWEILMIDSFKGRIKASLHMLFPSRGEIKSIYRTASSLSAAALTIPHFFIALSAILYFHLYFYQISTF